MTVSARSRFVGMVFRSIPATSSGDVQACGAAVSNAARRVRNKIKHPLPLGPCAQSTTPSVAISMNLLYKAKYIVIHTAPRRLVSVARAVEHRSGRDHRGNY